MFSSIINLSLFFELCFELLFKHHWDCFCIPCFVTFLWDFVLRLLCDFASIIPLSLCFEALLWAFSLSLCFESLLWALFWDCFATLLLSSLWAFALRLCFEPFLWAFALSLLWALLWGFALSLCFEPLLWALLWGFALRLCFESLLWALLWGFALSFALRLCFELCFSFTRLHGQPSLSLIWFYM